MLKLDEVYLGDCLDVMMRIDDASIDMVLCDLPYGMTAFSWDSIIPLDRLWLAYNRIIKQNASVVLTAIQPFSSLLVSTNWQRFRYALVWDKVLPTDFMHAKYRPMRQHEDILVFSLGRGTFNPQKTPRKKPRIYTRTPKSSITATGISGWHDGKSRILDSYSPRSIIRISNADHTQKLHPTQKPVALFEYLIKTYTNEGGLVLDNACGSGTTGVACKNTGRHYILIDNDPKYVEISCQRLKQQS